MLPLPSEFYPFPNKQHPYGNKLHPHDNMREHAVLSLREPVLKVIKRQ